MGCCMPIYSQILALKTKIEKAILDFSAGIPILIGDDGKRENEVDLVFHARFATPELVNLAITHAKGLLCVALDHHLADKFGFYTSPRFPGGISHTNFTLSVDAKNNITSGISAKDRAHTIQLMGDEGSQASDFITPGHIFPLRSQNGGLTSRAGHTEAVYELCYLSKLPAAGAICEILNDIGEPVTPDKIKEHSIFSKLTYINTIDLLWYKILYCKQDHFIQHINSNLMLNQPIIIESNTSPWDDMCVPCSIELFSQKFNPDTLRIVLQNGSTIISNNVKKEDCCAEIILFSFKNLNQTLPNDISEFCDLSEKVGLKNTSIAVKRFVTLLRSIQFVTNKLEYTITEQTISNLVLPVESDEKLLFSILK
jgi:3,4-dihydroxy 2-butanone 4-phosphate synthase/GTP cyclohydrolase II